MNKLLTIAGALIAATTLFASTADAGFGIRLGFGGPLPSFVAHGNSGDYGRGSSEYTYRKRIHRQERQAKAAVRAGKKSVETSRLAQDDDKPVVAPELSKADSENSSISLASADVVTQAAEPADPITTVSEDTSSENVGCKKFFPSVGMTLTVRCD